MRKSPLLDFGTCEMSTWDLPRFENSGKEGYTIITFLISRRSYGGGFGDRKIDQIGRPRRAIRGKLQVASRDGFVAPPHKKAALNSGFPTQLMSNSVPIP
jgi:hypothetical protein